MSSSSSREKRLYARQFESGNWDAAFALSAFFEERRWRCSQRHPPAGVADASENGCSPVSGPANDLVAPAWTHEMLAQALAANPLALIRAMAARPGLCGRGVNLDALLTDVCKGKFRI